MNRPNVVMRRSAFAPACVVLLVVGLLRGSPVSAQSPSPIIAEVDSAVPRIWAVARVNGRVARFLLDTGTSCPVLITHATMRRLGLAIRKPPAPGLPVEMAQDIPLRFTQDCEVAFARHARRGSLAVFPATLDQLLERGRIDGIIGWSILRQLTLAFDWTAGRVRAVRAVPKEALRWTRWPIESNSTLVVRIPIGRGPAHRVVIDTGSPYALMLEEELWDTLPIDRTDIRTLAGAFHGSAGITVQPVAWAGRVAVGPDSIAGLPVHRFKHLPSRPRSVQAILGTLGLSRFDMYIDGPKGVVYARPRETFHWPCSYNRLGACFVPRKIDDERWFAHVLRDSPAHKVGVRDGDQLLRINGRDVAELKMRPPWGRLGGFTESDAGTEYELTLKNDAGTRTVTVKLEELFSDASRHDPPPPIKLPLVQRFARPKTLGEAAALPDAEIDPVWVALLAEAPLFPQADRHALIDQVDVLADQLAPLLHAETVVMGKAQRAADFLLGDAGFACAGGGSSDPGSPALPVHDVLRSRTGHGSGLSIVFVSLCRRVGLEARIGGAPYHSFAWVDDGGAGVIVEFAERGRVHTRSEYLARLGLADGDRVGGRSGKVLISACLHEAGLRARSDGRLDLFRRLNQQALAWDPNNPYALMERADFRQAAGDLDTALILVEKAHAARPAWPDIQVHRADLLNRLGRPGDAETVLQRAFESDLGGTAYWTHLGQALSRGGSWLRSRRTATRGDRLDATDLAALYLKAGIASKCKKHAETLKACDRYLAWCGPPTESGPRGAFAGKRVLSIIHRLRGMALAGMKKWPAAVAGLDRAIALDGDDLRARAEKAKIYIACRAYDVAEEQLEQILERDPGRVEARMQLGRALYQQGRFSEAVEQFRRVTELDAGSWKAWRWLGWVLDRQGKTRAALPAAKKVCELDPDFARGWLEAGMMEAKLASPARAGFRSWGAALGNLPWGAGELARRCAEPDAFAYLRHVGRAFTCFDRAMEIAPAFLEAWDAAADLCHEHGFATRAAACASRAHELRKTSPSEERP